MLTVIDKFTRFWRCSYNPFRLQSLKDFFGIFAGFTGIILLLVTLGPLKLVPIVEVGEIKKVTMVNIDRWLQEYDIRGNFGRDELVQAMQKRNIINVFSSNKKGEARYLCIDPAFKRQCKNPSKDNDIFSDDFALDIAKQRLGYAERRNWVSKNIILKKDDDLFKWLFMRHNLHQAPLGDTNWTRHVFPTDIVHDVIESIQNVRAKRFAYENLYSARKTYTALSISNPGTSPLRNIRIALNLRDNYPARLMHTLDGDGIFLQQDSDEYKELVIQLLPPNEPKFLVIETGNGFVSKDKIAVAYDLVEKVNWGAAKILLWIGLFLSFGVIFLEKLCRGIHK